MIFSKPLHITCDRINGFIRVYDGTIYLVLFCPEKYDAIYYRSRYLIGLKSGITYVFSYSFGKNKIDSDDDLPLEKTLTWHNITIHMISVLNKDQNHYSFNLFLEKCLYQLTKK